MKKSELNSALIEEKGNKLAITKEKIELLRRFNIENLSEFLEEEKKIKEEIEVLEKEKDDCDDNLIENSFKKKENPFYFRAESASITGDTVGDPLKDTSGPSLNILIKLSSILSVVFSPLFLNTSFFA